jgi:hypothetical protein
LGYGLLGCRVIPQGRVGFLVHSSVSSRPSSWCGHGHLHTFWSYLSCFASLRGGVLEPWRYLPPQHHFLAWRDGGLVLNRLQRAISPLFLCSLPLSFRGHYSILTVLIYSGLFHRGFLLSPSIARAGCNEGHGCLPCPNFVNPHLQYRQFVENTHTISP